MRAGASSGFFSAPAKIVARVRLERHHATGHAAVRGLVVQQRQHGLVPAVHAVEVADGQGAGRRDAGVVEAAKNLHRVSICFGSKKCPSGTGNRRKNVTKTGYIVIQQACRRISLSVGLALQRSVSVVVRLLEGGVS
jgi:hypothetical protein